ncbi:hypothetical protein WICPIJ_008853 [Wickerhamomyces pijperi]|uniref:RING-type E3 ubiquitin transferase n=1 Tax=Wickerhamomyces pijperi TaxID=599730 RepID=A0A9P8TG41_WICPI|nr:hypothetical protein WICPIJ_008853 [Wickerhamomyces pijperi]
MSSPSPAMTMSAPTPTATSTGSLSSGSAVSQPSSILFFIAVAIGVLIALLFLFFSVRYYVRSRMGIFATARITTLDNGVIIVSNDYPAQTLNAYTPEAFDVVRAQRRRRRRYLKKRRLTEEELDHLFPVRTYQNWLDGGAELDAKNRDIAAQLKEEHDEDVQHDEAEQEQAVSELPQAQDTANNEINVNNPNQEVASSSSSNDHDHNVNKEIDLSNPSEAEMHFDSGTCAICIDTFEPEDQVRGLICGHVFHQECLDPWLTKRKACCPMCKRDYYMKNNNRSEDGENDGNEADDNASMALPEVQYTTVSERVTEILSNHPEYQAQAEERIKRYMSRGYRFLWVIMGISVHDLLNSAIMELDYENSYTAEGRQRTEAAAAAAAAAADPSHPASDPTATSGDTALNSTSNPVSVECPLPSIAQIPTLTDVTVTHANIVDDRIDHSLESEAQASRDRISGTIV